MLANELISRGPQNEKTYLLSRSSSGKVRWQYGRAIQISMDDRARVVAGPANIVAQRGQRNKEDTYSTNLSCTKRNTLKN